MLLSVFTSPSTVFRRRNLHARVNLSGRRNLRTHCEAQGFPVPSKAGNLVACCLSSFTGRRGIVLKVSLLLSVIRRSLLCYTHVCLSVCTYEGYPLKRVVCSLTGLSCSLVCTYEGYPLKRVVCSLTGLSCSLVCTYEGYPLKRVVCTLTQF